MASTPGDGPRVGPSPYHSGELSVQSRAGRSRQAERAARTIRGSLTDVLAAFLGMQEMAVAGAADAEGRLWASLLTGPPGFARATGPRSLSLALTPATRRPPLDGSPGDGAFPLGVLFTDLRTRLRLRVNGTASRTGRGLSMETEQVFTNCPGQVVKGERRRPPQAGPQYSLSGSALTPEQQDWIRGAHTFFIATASGTGAADASHRGGEPGFVHVASPTELSWPDYPGNSMFMTLGNLELNPRAGLLFVDWESGRSLQLTGTAHVSFSNDARTVRFTAARVVES